MVTNEQAQASAPRRRMGKGAGNRKRTMLGLAVAVAVGVASISLTVGVAPSAEAAPVGQERPLAVASVSTPPADMAWIEGMITDQAGKPLENVNVEAWPTDPEAEGPAASTLTYASNDPDDPTLHPGVFRLEVEAEGGFRIVASGIGGAEDGDSYVMKTLGGTGGFAVAPGRVIDIGTFALQDQGIIIPTPPAEMAWIEGTITDQAGKPLENVNVEAWPDDPEAEEPAASNLTYAGNDPDDPTVHAGLFRLEVEAEGGYRILASVVGGVEDGDGYVMKVLGGGRAFAVAPGRVINVGTVALLKPRTVVGHPQPKFASRTTASLTRHRVPAKTRAVVAVHVRSAKVANVTGIVRIKVGSRKPVVRRLTAGMHGNLRVALPRLMKGRYAVRVAYLGAPKVTWSQARPLTLVVG